MANVTLTKATWPRMMTYINITVYKKCLLSEAGSDLSIPTV